MRSAFALTGLAILCNFNVALAGPCKPHGATSHTEATVTTAGPTTSETKGPLVVKNVIGNGNFALRDPTNPSNIPNYTVEGQGQIVENKGYTGDGSKETGCVELQAANSPPGRKRAIGNIVSISQQLDSLDIKKKYTVRFFYAVVTASQINVCTLSASIAGHQFYTSTILSIGTAIDWNTVLEQTDVPNTQGAFSVSVNCPIGGVAAIYVDSIFMSNQVTPQTINDISIDYADGNDVATTSGLPVGSTTSNAPNSNESTNSPSTQTKSSTGTDAVTSEIAHPTTGLSMGSDTETFHPSTDSPSSNLVCEKIGNLGAVDLQPYANNDFDKATMQTNSEQCATICYQLDGCAASAHDAGRGRCIFTNVAMTSSAFQEAQALDGHDYILPWSSQGCWSCSNDCSVQHDTTSQAPSSTEHIVEHTTITPTRTEPLTTFISSYVPTTTESAMPQCTLALSDGCTFDQNNHNYQDCSKSGTMKNTFTLSDNEYPWQEGINSYQNCVAICNQMPHRCKSSAWDQNQQACVFSSNSIFTSAFTSGNGDDQDMDWSDQSCWKCFCHDQDRDAYSASLRTALPTATCTPSITSEDAVCSIKQVDNGDLVCQHQGYFPWQWDEAPSKFPNQDSEERCAALCNSNPDCQASGWSEEYGKCAIGGFQLKDITWQQFGDTKLSWSDKGCWDCSECIKSQKWRIYN
ncbi:hypothetical protein NOF04DRAFT_1211315 [Fusarium oxysporum II5]|nr:hypothetical protein NOF04DRAFT_1211315 [Fusarium oxysporum II5]